MHRALFALSCFIIATAVLAQNSPAPSAGSPAALRLSLESSKRRGQLEMDSAPAFHLKATFEMIDGSSTSKGSFEEVWKDSAHYSQTINQAGETFVEVRNESHWRTGSWKIQNRVVLALNAVVRPFYNLPRGDRLNVEGQKNGSQDLDCVGTEPDIAGVPADVRIAETTFCMSKGNHLLRLIARPNGFSLAFNDAQAFGKKYIPRSIDVFDAGSLLLRLRVNSLAMTDDFSALEIPQPPDAQNRQDSDALFYEGLMVGQVLEAPYPRLPPLGHQGTVVLKVTIDDRGHVETADVISSPSPFLTNSALSSVKNWRYRVSYEGDNPARGFQVVSMPFN